MDVFINRALARRRSLPIEAFFTSHPLLWGATSRGTCLPVLCSLCALSAFGPVPTPLAQGIPTAAQAASFGRLPSPGKEQVLNQEPAPIGRYA